MFKRGITAAALIGMGVFSISLGCRSTQRVESQAEAAASSRPAVHYVEIVTEDVDAVTGLYQAMYGVSFGAPDADLGQARVATLPDGTLLGVRKPLAAHEQPTMRTYLAVEDIQAAVKKAAQHGATIAYPPTHQGQRGTFAIVIQGGVEHGLWQR